MRAIAITVTLSCLGFSSLCGGDCRAAEKLSAAEIKPLVDRHLSRNPNYRPGDLICRSDVEPIFNELIERGINPVDNQEELYDSFLPDESRLVRTLRSQAGTAFMRQVNRLPGAYDRLERLSWSASGRDMLDELVAADNGAQLFERMMTPEGTEAIEKMLAADPRGRNWRLPTGHIHTEAQLIRRLEKLARDR